MYQLYKSTSACFLRIKRIMKIYQLIFSCGTSHLRLLRFQVDGIGLKILTWPPNVQVFRKEALGRILGFPLLRSSRVTRSELNLLFASSRERRQCLAREVVKIT